MYNVFDDFVKAKFWYFGIEVDNHRFFQALSNVNHFGDCDAYEMGEYIRMKLGISGTNPNQIVFNDEMMTG